MNKFEFLTLLRERLSGLPCEDIEKTLDYYSEMIDDRVEEGLTEDEAVAALGNLDTIVTQAFADSAAFNANARKEESAKEPPKRRELKPWMVVLIVLGAPVWVSLLVGAVSIAAGVVIAVGSAFISLYATAIAFIGASVGCIAGAFLFETGAEVMLAIGVAMMLVGGGVLLLFATNWLLKCIIKPVKLICLKIKAFAAKRRAKREAL